MLENYLIIHKDILPDYYEKVIEARRLVESGKVKDVSQAVKQVGISRSTYYKYKDYILESLDISAMPGSMAGLIESLGSTPGAEQVRLLAVE